MPKGNISLLRAVSSEGGEVIPEEGKTTPSANDNPLHYTGCYFRIACKSNDVSEDYLRMSDFIAKRLETKFDFKKINNPVQLDNYVTDIRIYDSLAGVQFQDGKEQKTANPSIEDLKKRPTKQTPLVRVKLPAGISPSEKSNASLRFEKMPASLFDTYIMSGLVHGTRKEDFESDDILFKISYQWTTGFQGTTKSGNNYEVIEDAHHSQNYYIHVGEFKMVRNVKFHYGNVVDFELVVIPSYYFGREGNLPPSFPRFKGDLTMREFFTILYRYSFMGESEDSSGDTNPLKGSEKIKGGLKLDSSSDGSPNDEVNVFGVVLNNLKAEGDAEKIQELKLGAYYQLKSPLGTSKADEILFTYTDKKTGDSYYTIQKNWLKNCLSYEDMFNKMANMMGANFTYVNGKPTVLGANLHPDEIRDNVSLINHTLIGARGITKVVEAAPDTQVFQINLKGSFDYSNTSQTLTTEELRRLFIRIYGFNDGRFLNNQILKSNPVKGLEDLIQVEKDLEIYNITKRNTLAPSQKQVQGFTVKGPSEKKGTFTFRAVIRNTKKNLKDQKRVKKLMEEFRDRYNKSLDKSLRILDEGTTIENLSADQTKEQLVFDYEGYPISCIVTPQINQEYGLKPDLEASFLRADLNFDVDWEKFSLVTASPSAVTQARASELAEKKFGDSPILKSALFPEKLSEDKLYSFSQENAYKIFDEISKDSSLLKEFSDDLEKRFGIQVDTVVLTQNTGFSLTGGFNVKDFTSRISKRLTEEYEKLDENTDPAKFLAFQKANEALVGGFSVKSKSGEELTLREALGVYLPFLEGYFQSEADRLKHLAKLQLSKSGSLRRRILNTFQMSPVKASVSAMTGFGSVSSNSIILVQDCGSLSGLYRVQSVEHVWSNNKWTMRLALLWDEQANANLKFANDKTSGKGNPFGNRKKNLIVKTNSFYRKLFGEEQPSSTGGVGINSDVPSPQNFSVSG